MNLGISGKLTRATIMSPLTPLFLLAAILVGLLATITIPREEEPQIKVPMVDIMVQAPGLSAREAVELVGKPLETIVKSVDGVEHVYTQAQDNGALVTARFLVGIEPRRRGNPDQREDRGQQGPDSGWHSRAASDGARDQRRADRGADPDPQTGRGRAVERSGAGRTGGQAAGPRSPRSMMSA